MDTLRKKLIRLAHDQPELRSDILPLLRTSAWNSVGETIRYRNGGKGMTDSPLPFENGEYLEIVGLEPHQYTPYGPQPFVGFYWVERVAAPGEKYLVPPQVINQDLGKHRDDYKHAFKILGQALRKGGLKKFKRKAQPHVLGYENQGPEVGLDEIERALVRHPAIKGSGSRLTIEIPVGQTKTRAYPLKVYVLVRERVDLYPA